MSAIKSSDVNLVDMWRSQFGESVGPRFGLIWLLGVNALAGLIAAPVSAATHAEIRALRAGGQRFA